MYVNNWYCCSQPFSLSLNQKRQFSHIYSIKDLFNLNIGMQIQVNLNEIILISLYIKRTLVSMNLGNRIRWFFCDKKLNTKMINNMAQRIEAMKAAMNSTTPKAFSLLLIFSTIPTFYYGYQLCSSQYNHKEFTDNAHYGIKYFYLKNIIFFTAGLVLTQINFNNPSGQYTVKKTPIRRAFLPLLFSFIGLMLPQWDSPLAPLPAIITDFFTLSVQLKLTNQASIPFWFYSFRHYIRFFDVFTLIVIGVALWRFKKRIASHPYQFVQQHPKITI